MIYRSKLLLVIEVDGGYHSEIGKEDENRETWMKSKEIKTIRFTNDKIEKNMEGVVLSLEDIIKEKEIGL